MGFLETHCTFKHFSPELLISCNTFDCGHNDLNDFFTKDCINYSKELLGKTYCFTLDENPNTIVCIFTISNDSIKASLLPNARKKKVSKCIPHEKHMRNYPAVLIGRLGVNNEFKGKGIGRELIDFIKSWFIDEQNKTGCRFIVVDSYNEESPIIFYKKNDFNFLFGDEADEKKYMGMEEKASLKTRLMYFDLILLRKQN